MCYTHLNLALLLHKTVLVMFLLASTVSSCDPPTTVHNRSAQIWADWLCSVAGELQEDTSRILRITFLKSGIQMTYDLSKLSQDQPISTALI